MRNSQRKVGTANDANIFFSMPRSNAGLVAGLRADILPDLVSNMALPSVVVGGVSRDGKVRKGATIVPALLTDRPLFDRHNKLIRASVTDQKIDDKKSRKVLVSHREGNDWYVLIRTGFQFGTQGLMGDYMNLLSKGVVLKSHGSFNFDKKGGAYKVAEGREEKSDFGTVAAEKIDNIHGRKIKALGYSAVNYDLWRIPEGAVVIVRDVDGKMLRLIGGKAQLLVQDADGYDRFFDCLHDEDAEQRAKAIVAAQAAKAAGDPNYNGVGVKLGNQSN